MANSRNYSGYKGGGDPDPVYWMGQMRKGIEFRKKAAYEEMWKNWESYYRGDFSGSVLPVNIFFKMIRTLVPRIYFRDPTVSVTQEKPGQEYALLAQMLERIDNKLIRQMKYKAQMKLSIQDACMYGTGMLKLGFGAQFTPVPDVGDTDAPQVKGGYKVEYSSLVTANMPWVMRVHPRNIIMPEKCVSFSGARWIMHTENVHIDDLREDPRFTNVKDIQPSKPIQNNTYRGAKADDLPEGFVQIVEIRDKKSGMVFVMAPYHSQKIILQDDDLFTQQHNRFPFYPIIFNQDPTRCWGLADSKILDPQQRELNEIRTQEMKHRRHALVKFIGLEDGMTPDEAEKLDNEDVGSLVIVSSLDAVREITAVSQMPPALLQMDQNVQREVQELIGLGTNQFGEYAPGSADRSATEASIVNQATQIRMDERRDAVADVTEEIISGVNSIIFENWTETEVVDVIGDDGVTFWVKIAPQELKSGSYDVNVDPDTGMPTTAAARKQTAVQVYTLLQQNPLINSQKLTSYLLREFHGAEYDDMMKTPQELQQQQQQIQQQKQEALKDAITLAQFGAKNPKTMAARGSMAGGQGRR